MIRCCLVGLILLAAGLVARADDAGFTRSLTPEDFKAAGLDRLSPAELQRLDDLINAYKNSDLAAARRSAAEAIAARKAAEAAAETAKAETKAAKAETKAAQAEAAESKKSNRGFLAKAKVLLVPGTKIEYAVIKTTIVGRFEGWDGHTIFTLANGQRWQVANSEDRYFTPPKQDVEVQIAPSAFGGFWMYLPGLRTQVRVKLLSDR